MSEKPLSNTAGRWNVLVVDDDDDIHSITLLALKYRKWRDLRFNVVSARSAAEARTLLSAPDAPQYHVALVDVVMETETAGLDLCKSIRETYPASLRIILRTGQPGMAPEEKILAQYDIDYWLAKGEVTDKRLFAAVRACVRTCEDLLRLEDANIALTVKNAELLRMDRFRQAVLQNIGDPKAGYVAEIVYHADLLSKASATLPPTLQRSATALSRLGKKVCDTFSPYGSNEASHTGDWILCALADRNAQRYTHRALMGTSAAVVSAKNEQEARESLRSGRIDLLYVDWENAGLIAEAQKYNPRMLTVLVTTEPTFQKNGELIMDLPISSLVISQPLAQDVDRPVDPLTLNELVVTAAKLLSRDIFGLEKYLSWGTAVREERVRDSKERNATIDRVVDYAKQCRLSGKLRRALGALTDELLMNAIWDAPVNQLGQAKYATQPRNEPVQLDPNEVVTLRYGSDGNRFGLSVSDNFGGLERDIAVRYIKKALGASDRAKIHHGPGGAGLGLCMSFLAVTALIINVSPSRRTEVIGLLNMNTPSQQEQQRSFHYFRAIGER